MQSGAFRRIAATAQPVAAVGAPGLQSLQLLGFLRDELLHFLPGLQRISLQQMQLGFNLLPVAQVLGIVGNQAFGYFLLSNVTGAATKRVDDNDYEL